jgi:hypothetical protein
MREPPDRSPKQKSLISLAWCVLVITVPFVLFTACVPCQQMEIGASSSYIQQVAPQRIPLFLLGTMACAFALAAAYFLAKLSHEEEAPEKTAYSCGIGCLGLLLFVMVMLLFGYISSQ